VKFESRRITILLIVACVGFIYLLKLFLMQVTDSSWSKLAQEYSQDEVPIHSPRGIIYDRKGRVLVTNQTVYDLMVIPRNVKAFDTTAFCALVKLTPVELRTIIKKGIEKSKASYKAFEVIKQMTPREYAAISEQLFKYPGFFGQPRSLRVYPQEIAALLLGDVGEISPGELEKYPDFKQGYYIGKSGIELSYDKELRGITGRDYFFVDHLNKKRDDDQAVEDVPAQAGLDLVATIDAELQRYGEELMQNKRGCIVAIEPETGEILALVSAPTYNPNLLVGRARGHNFKVLNSDPQKPLFNRATQAQYRPGSIFKLAQSLTALELGAITPETRIRCNRGIIACHGSHSNDDLEMAIVHSCNPYFREVMHRVIEAERDPSSKFKDSRQGLGIWEKYIESFGFDSDLATDIPNVKKGLVPGVSFYDKWYGELQWKYSTIYSLSIGEGEMLITPLQMCNLACILANRGWYVPPHTVKQQGIGGLSREEFLVRHQLSIDSSHFRTVVNAMEKVVGPGGTANRAKIKDIVVCGKTGTVQNEPREDHAVFICFAPKDNPKIALAVYVENAGFGGTWSAPIASLMIEKYLNDSIADRSKEKRIFEANFLDQ